MRVTILWARLPRDAAGESIANRFKPWVINLPSRYRSVNDGTSCFMFVRAGLHATHMVRRCLKVWVVRVLRDALDLGSPSVVIFTVNLRRRGQQFRMFCHELFLLRLLNITEVVLFTRLHRHDQCAAWPQAGHLLSPLPQPSRCENRRN
jgi:hypothetical protein